MGILSLLKDPDKERIEDQLVRLLQAITHYFPESKGVESYELLLTLTELIETEQTLQISDCISGVEPFHSQEGEYAVVSLKCALQNKIDINKSQNKSLKEEIEHTRTLIGTGTTAHQNKQYTLHLSHLEKSLDAAQRIKTSPHYSLLFTTILHETRIMQKIKEIESKPDCDDFKNRRIKLMNELLTLLTSFRNNQISLDMFHFALQKHARKTRVIPHTSTIGATFGFFAGKLTDTAKLSYDYLEIVTQLKEAKQELFLKQRDRRF